MKFCQNYFRIISSTICCFYSLKLVAYYRKWSDFHCHPSKHGLKTCLTSNQLTQIINLQLICMLDSHLSCTNFCFMAMNSHTVWFRDLTQRLLLAGCLIVLSYHFLCCAGWFSIKVMKKNKGFFPKYTWIGYALKNSNMLFYLSCFKLLLPR